MTLLSVENIDVAYGEIQVLWDVSLSVDVGETVALLGANGAGKSTVMKTICGNLSPLDGRIVFKGEEIGHEPADEVVPKGIAHVPEGREIFADSTIEENLRLGAHVNRSGLADRREWVFDLFPQLEERRGQIAGTLSGGERQMLAIGRGLMSEPDLLLLDEASLGLAPVIVEDVFESIDAINESGTTVLLVEQNLQNALEVADRGYVLESGRNALSGDVSELAATEKIEGSYLGG